MRKHYLLLFFLSLFLVSCDEFYVVNNTRLSFTGTIMDKSGNPLPEIYLYSEGVDHGEYRNIGKGYTDGSGGFQVISLKSYENNFHINRSENSNFYYDSETQQSGGGITDSVYTSVDYFDVPGSMDLGTIKLRRRAYLSFKIHKTSTSNDTLFWRLSYTHATCTYIFENGVLLEEESSCYETFPDDPFHTQIPLEPNFERTYRTILGGTAEFTYHINDQPEQSILLTMDETQETYVFQY